MRWPPPVDGDPVLVHDAARPLLYRRAGGALPRRLGDADAAIAAARVTDTTKESGPDGVVARTLDRSRLWAVQTPQVFPPGGAGGGARAARHVHRGRDRRRPRWWRPPAAG
jgi:hypothetical protein